VTQPRQVAQVLDMARAQKRHYALLLVRQQDGLKWIPLDIQH
jgi:hypothetical protein